MFHLQLKTACRHLAKVNDVNSFIYKISLGAAQQELDRHHELGTRQVDETVALSGPVMNQELGKDTACADAEKNREVPKEVTEGISAGKPSSSPVLEDASQSGAGGERYYGDCPFSGPRR